MARSAAETRRRIIDAAYGMFWRQGFVRASLDDIADRAKVTKRTLYQHFRSKDDLMAEVLAHASELAISRLHRISDRLPKDREAMLDAVFAELAQWAGQPRWSGAGFTRAVRNSRIFPAIRRARLRDATRPRPNIGSRIYSNGLAFRSADERGREVALLMEGALSLMLIHGDPSYATAAAGAAKRLVKRQVRHEQVAILYALISAALFGASTPAAKLLLGTMDPVLLAGLLYCGAGIGIAIVRRTMAPRSPRPCRRHLPGRMYLGSLARSCSAAFLDRC